MAFTPQKKGRKPRIRPSALAQRVREEEAGKMLNTRVLKKTYPQRTEGRVRGKTNNNTERKKREKDALPQLRCAQTGRTSCFGRMDAEWKKCGSRREKGLVSEKGGGKGGVTSVQQAAQKESTCASGCTHFQS